MKSSKSLKKEGSRRRPHRVSSFAEKVYAIVSTILRGEVRTYQWVAGQLGNPRAARAVGQALKRNPNLVIVPCHRVIRSDGKLGGYAGGQFTKVKLLRREGVPLGSRSQLTEKINWNFLNFR